MNANSLPPARLPAIVAPVSRHLSVADLDRSAAFYRDVLGFDVRSVSEGDSITILLIASTKRHTGIGSCYVSLRDADALHAELLARRGNVQGEPISHPWGLRDFHVLDSEGNQIRFGQTFE
jgi:catechol 2,3-dioxygenase-like lactoylglutathione lyase family enzyme